MELIVHFFAAGRDIVGASSLHITLPEPVTAQALLDYLKARYPQFAQLRSLSVAVNEDYASPQQILQETDEIAIIPPVCGG
ncbi:MAG: molybdopterin converting factor subunit 1 [Chloroherpetonaceae bacterium]|nr:molybdopterin converting factor subunit 1 [Chloroherpetonaceae bacterium]MCS7210960.1 molybdopterin converting factor subunit 1 [Chloroherpetonaceae bacterium]MDW8020246.1 molybdopterin converting factor subunit 1 [Chloroherpetonaceae bacterium]